MFFANSFEAIDASKSNRTIVRIMLIIVIFFVLIFSKIPAHAAKSATLTHTHSTKCYKTTATEGNSRTICGLDEGVVGTVLLSADNSKWDCHPVMVNLILDISSGVKLAKNPFSWNGAAGCSATSIEVGEPTTVSCEVRTENAGSVTVSMSIKYVDLINPKMSVSVSNTAWTKEPVTISLSGSDNLSGLSANAYTFDGGSTFDSGSTYVVRENGSYLVGVRDKAGNTVYKDVVISNIDNKGPIIYDYTPSITSWTNKVMTLTVWKVEDEGVGLHTYAYSHDGGANYTANPSVEIRKNGTYSVIVRDRLGNSSSTSFTVSNIDMEAPGISNLTADSTNWVKGPVNINVSATDSVSGIEGYSFDGGKTFGSSSSFAMAQNGTVNVVVKDKAGNTASKSITVNNIDSIAPEIQSLTKDKTSWTTDGVTISVSATDGQSGLASESYSFDGGKSFSSSSTYVANENGTYSVCVKDKAGNISSRNISINNIDKTAPLIKSFGAADSSWTNGRVKISVDASDTESGLAVLAYSFDGQPFDTNNSISVTGNGSHSVTVKDMAGNSASATVTISNIDKAAPSIAAVTASTSKWTKDSVTVSVTANDKESGIEAYSFDGGNTYTSSASYTVSKNSSLDIVVKDKAGNTASSSIRISNIDKTSPEISNVSAGGSEWTNKDVTISVTAADKQSGLATEAYSYNGGSFTASSTYVVAKNGTYSVTVRDQAGNTSEKTINVTNIDKEAPIINAITKSTEEWTEEGLIISVDARDNDGGSGGLTYSFDGGNKYVLTSSAIVRRNGSFSICVKDRSGNVTSQSVTVANIGKSPSQAEKERLEAQKEAERKAAEQKEAEEKLKEAEKKRQEQEAALKKAEDDARKAKEEAEAKEAEAKMKKEEAEAKKKAYEEAQKEAEAKKKAYEEAQNEKEKKEREEAYKKSVEEEKRLEEEYKKSLEEKEAKQKEAEEAKKSSSKTSSKYDEELKKKQQIEDDYRKASQNQKKAQNESQRANENAQNFAKKVEEEQKNGILNGIKNAFHDEKDDIKPYEGTGNLIEVNGEEYKNSLSDASILQNNSSIQEESNVANKNDGQFPGFLASVRNRVIIVGSILLFIGVFLVLTLNYIYMYDGKHIANIVCVGIKSDKARTIVNVKAGKISKEGKYRIYFSVIGRLFMKNKPVYVAVEGKEDIITTENDRSFEYSLH